VSPGALSAAVVLVLAAPARAIETPRQEFARAVGLFESFQDAQATALLRDVLYRAPGSPVAAKAHVYLGLIALNATDAERAKTEFQKAIATDVLVDLPPAQSPKAQVLFAQARRDLAAAPIAAPGAPPMPPQSAAPPAAAPAVLAVAPPAVSSRPEAGPSHAAAWATGGAGLGALAVGGLFGYLQLSAANAEKSDGDLTSALHDGQPYAQDGIVADVLYATGGAAIVAAIVLYFVERPSARSRKDASVGVAPGGLSLSGHF